MIPDLRRRGLVAGLLGAAALPAALARERTRVVGLITMGQGAKFLSPAMARHGWVEGRNLRFEVRQVTAQQEDIDAVAAGLAGAGVDVLVGSGAMLVLALQRATRTIPIVCGGISDPVEAGIAQSLQKPGMNVTGLSFGLRESAVLQLGALHRLVPGLKRVVFVTSEADAAGRVAGPHEDAARSHGITTEFSKVSDAAAVERALLSLRPGSDAAWVAFLPRGTAPKEAADAALRRGIATHGHNPEYVRAGMLLSYWNIHSDQLGRIAALVDKVLRGTPPGTIPFEQPDKTDFAINRGTAKGLGIRLPDDMLVRATEVYG